MKEWVKDTFEVASLNNQTVTDHRHREHSRTTTRWYNFGTLRKSDDFRRVAVESVDIVQSVDPIARWKAK